MSDKMYCTVCHTAWTETCWKEWQPCPFKGCDGRLSRTPPAGAVSPPRKKEPKTYPLLEASES